ncbi:beta-1,4-mannosyl-glycoprotein 4-beta-N-acetylglucosaminyltransferase [Neolamprologus brichardi]|uniref:beta-1,4-mannosyl-glycoprotein 4-beta-N-acetylglucosaminyltransferase n=1 Tax=Neolamprologus brichardi TaxID=32507 RepID=UPI0003EBF0E4|nr:beta-1,4-mannosyl-glycoprotein 4-beta-N-acetylglucosaminyltransferase [Neolamprologus brichardi]
MKMRRHRVFLLCTVGLCVISFLHYYKALHYVSLLRELSAPYPNIKSFIMVTGFFWREKGMATTPLSPASPEEAPPLPGLRQSDAKARGVPGLGGGGGGEGFGPGIPEAIAGGGDEEMRQREEPAPPHPWEKPKENQLGDAANEESNGCLEHFLRLLLNGTYDYIRHKILYVFLNHFPDGGRQDGWIADDYLRTFLTRNGMSRVVGARSDDVFVINDADEIPAHEGLLFLKLFDGWTEPFAIHMRKSLYGFFWKQFGSLEVVSGCTLRMLHDVYDGDGIKLRRREYYTMPGFRKYENDTGHILVQWSVGSPFHFAGWHCSWCFTPEGIYFKLVSAQNGDFPRWGDYEDKRDLNYIRDLIRTGGWFDGSLQEYPPVDPKEHMYAPKYMLENYDRYRYLLENPYRKESRANEG